VFTLLSTVNVGFQRLAPVHVFDALGQLTVRAYQPVVFNQIEHRVVSAGQTAAELVFLPVTHLGRRPFGVAYVDIFWIIRLVGLVVFVDFVGGVVHLKILLYV
jgi:hypothetical protein